MSSPPGLHEFAPATSRLCTERPGSTGPVETWRRAILHVLDDVKQQIGGSLADEIRVHRLRRAGKQLRALALLAPASLEDLACETRDCADGLRRSLGNSRDAAVRRQTFEVLVSQMHPSATRLSAALQPPAEATGSAALPNDLVNAFAALAHDWSSRDLRGIGAHALVERLAETYRRAHKRRKAAKNGAMRHLHRWRRAIVDLDLQANAFANHSPRMARIGQRAHALRDLLGRVTDINALSEFLGHAAGDDAEALASFEKAASRERQRLTRKAMKHGKRLLKRKPDAWADEVAALLYAVARMADAAPAKVQQASM